MCAPPVKHVRPTKMERVFGQPATRTIPRTVSTSTPITPCPCLAPASEADGCDGIHLTKYPVLPAISPMTKVTMVWVLVRPPEQYSYATEDRASWRVKRHRLRSLFAPGLGPCQRRFLGIGHSTPPHPLS